MHRSALSDIKREAEAETVLRGPYNVIWHKAIQHIVCRKHPK